MRKCFLLLASLLFIMPAIAQKGIKFGLRFSPIVSWTNIRDDNNARVRDENGSSFSSRAGVSYGATVTYGFLDNLGIVSGVHIVNKGYSRTIGSLTVEDSATTTVITNATNRVRMTTVEIPFLIRGRTGEIVSGSNLYIVGNFGVSMDIGAGYRNEWTGIRPDTYYTDETTRELDTEGGEINGANYLNPVTLTFVFGAGVDYEIDGVGMINAGISYHQGLINMRRQRRFRNPDDTPTQFGTEEVRMNYIALDLSFFF